MEEKNGNESLNENLGNETGTTAKEAVEKDDRFEQRRSESKRRAAKWHERSVAAAIDVAICAPLIVVVFVIFSFVLAAANMILPLSFLGTLGRFLGPLFVAGIMGIWFVYRESFSGATIGKKMLGLYVVSAENRGKKISVEKAAVRFAWWFVPFAAVSFFAAILRFAGLPHVLVSLLETVGVVAWAFFSGRGAFDERSGYATLWDEKSGSKVVARGTNFFSALDAGSDK